MIEGLGGVSECFYYAFGENDVYAIAQLPDYATAAAVSLAITASGAVTTKIVVLLTPEEVDEAARKTVACRAPGAGGRAPRATAGGPTAPEGADRPAGPMK